MMINANASVLGDGSANVSSGTNSVYERANAVAGVNPVESNPTTKEWFNTAAFAVPAAGTWGNSGRNILEGPGTKTVDFSLFKDTHLTESKVLQLRAEAFNLANTPQFNLPAATAGTAAIGIVSSAGSDITFQRTERQIQFAAKITF